MSPARRISLLICSYMFQFALLTTISVAVINFSFRTPNLIKSSLTESKAYERFVPAIIEANTKNQQPGALPLNDPAIQAIANRDFSPKLLQSNTEQFVDAMYAWLEGKTYEPQFRINFNDAKQQFANDMGAYALQRTTALPICTSTTPATTFDAFNATCRPRGLQLEGQDQEIAAEIMGSKDFLPKSIFTQADLPKNSKGGSLVQQLAIAPLVYRLANVAMWTLGGFTLLLAAGIVFLRPSRWVGWRSLGMATLSSGLVMGVPTLIFGRLVPQLTKSFQTQISGSGTQLILNDVLQHITNDRQVLLLNIAIQVAALGGIILAMERFMRPNSPFVGLERMSGLVSGVKAMDEGKVHLVAAEVPLQSSENNWFSPVEKNSKKFSSIEEEIA